MNFDASNDFTIAYPHAPGSLRHGLDRDERFAIDRLIALAKSLPSSQIEYNAGDLPIDQDPSHTPMTGLSPEETLARIRECRSWMVIKNVESDPVFAAAMNDCLDELAPIIRRRTGTMHARQAYIFISSPGAVTPFHMDPEHNILLQIVGTKRMHVYPMNVARTLPGEIHEAYHAGDGHRNLRHDEAYERERQIFELSEGDAVYVPVKAPHRVENGEGVSISFSITWRSSQSVRESNIHRTNRLLRKLGAAPAPPGQSPARDVVKDLFWRAASRMGRRR